MGQSITQVDSFTNTRFTGNPAGVCVMPGPGDATWMQQVAAEMNLAETAFLYPDGDEYHLRWFTPTVEVDLCGHATLASAHVLWEAGHLAPTATARFRTRSGLLTATQQDGHITMDFPATPAIPVSAPEVLVAALGVKPVFVGQNQFDYLVEVESAALVRDLTPDLTSIATLPVRGIIVTSRSDVPTADFISRFFCPAVGIAEDPVTGSAHCTLAPYWSTRLGKTELVGYQASVRGGTVTVRLAGDRVHLGGQAITVLRGELA